MNSKVLNILRLCLNIQTLSTEWKMEVKKSQFLSIKAVSNINERSCSVLAEEEALWCEDVTHANTAAQSNGAL